MAHWCVGNKVADLVVPGNANEQVWSCVIVKVTLFPLWRAAGEYGRVRDQLKAFHTTVVNTPVNIYT